MNAFCSFLVQFAEQSLPNHISLFRWHLFAVVRFISFIFVIFSFYFRSRCIYFVLLATTIEFISLIFKMEIQINISFPVN